VRSSVEVRERLPDGRVLVVLVDDRGEPVPLEEVGETPLPPYIRRAPAPEDDARYQTVYARAMGAVAAPTAGLHFSEELLGAIGERGVAIARLVLHVGPGTFRPVTEETVEHHRMEPEAYDYPAAAASAVAAARREGGRIVAVGTTTTRVLETVGPAAPASAGETSLYIHPPFTFRVVDALVTNFHLPRSTLLLLVSAFAGRERVLSAYREAVARGYRFYSYGDAMLIL
jgi:S-adenosylmethionine:tRNA ribosyltransferase-isomerase